MRESKSYVFGVTAALLLNLIFALQAFADQSIILRSGNGAVGSQDAQVHFLAYGRTGDITPAASDFISVQTDKYAYIDAPYPTYIQSLPTDPLAHWISTTPNLGAGSALYAIPFTVTDPVIGSASLDLGYSVDNAINGIYINGTLISGNSHDGDYHGEYYELRSDIAPLLKPNAVNWLYINASDYGGYAGIIFNATIMVQGGSAAALSILPNRGGNAGQVTVQVIASGFQRAQPDSPGSRLKLTGLGQAIAGSSTTVLSPNVLTSTLNLTGAAPGVGTVTVTNPDGTSVSAPFTVTAGGLADVVVQPVGTPAVLGRTEWFFLNVDNFGSVDSGPTSLIAAIEPWSKYLVATPVPTTVDDLIFPATPFDAALNWNIDNIPPGKSLIFIYSVEQDPTFPTGEAVVATACTSYQLSIIRGDCEGKLQANLLLEDTKCSGFPNIGESCIKPVQSDYMTFSKCLSQEGAKCGGTTSSVRGSVDPNDITGPAGYGAQGWLIPTTPFQYALAFNNLPTATNPATNVYVTEGFDPATVDIKSLAVSGVTVPGASYSPSNVPLINQPFTHDIDLRPSQNLIVRASASLDSVTNKVSVSYLSLDPSTGLEPADPTIGFLPPGAGGTLLFTVNPKPGLTTGTAVQSSGSVVFDFNAAINTNVWLNTVDITPPVSHVVALPATETTTSFNVSWTGTDVGSGIADYSIYVSDNGGPYQYWLLNTMATSGTYTGAVGHTYAFYSIATDGAGNTESVKSAADTSTEIVTPPQCTNTINYASGFTGGGLTLNGGAAISGGALELTDGGSYEARSAFFPTAVRVGNFVTDFTFQLTNAQADGFAFVVQTNSPKALGGGEGGLGYAGIPNSAALKFDLFSNYGEGPSSTGFYLNGAYPAIPAVNLLAKGIDLHSGHIFSVHGVYSAPLVTVTITDTVTQASYTVSDKIAAMAPGGLAFVGFTGGTGRVSATQNILTWSYSSTLPCPVN